MLISILTPYTNRLSPWRKERRALGFYPPAVRLYRKFHSSPAKKHVQGQEISIQACPKLRYLHPWLPSRRCLRSLTQRTKKGECARQAIRIHQFARKIYGIYWSHARNTPTFRREGKEGYFKDIFLGILRLSSIWHLPFMGLLAGGQGWYARCRAPPRLVMKALHQTIEW